MLGSVVAYEDYCWVESCTDSVDFRLREGGMYITVALSARGSAGSFGTQWHTTAGMKDDDDKCTAVVDQVKSVEAVSLLKQFE